MGRSDTRLVWVRTGRRTESERKGTKKEWALKGTRLGSGRRSRRLESEPHRE